MVEQFDIGHFSHIRLHRLVGVGVLDAVDAAVGAVPLFGVGVMAVLLVVPVDDVNGAVGAVLEIDGDVFGIGAERHVASGVDGVEAGAFAEIDLLVDLVAVEIVREEATAIFGGPIVTVINHGADVGMAAVNGIAAALPCPTGAVVVTGGGEKVIAEFGEIAGRVGDDEVGIICVGLVPKDTALNDMGGAAATPVAAAMGHKNLAVLVVIEPPLVAAAFGEDFEFVANGMIAPDTGAEFGAFFLGSAGLADLRVIEDALVAVKPAVRSPHEAVEAFVRVLVAEAIEQDLRFAVRFVVAIFVGDEEEVRSRTDPDAAETDFEPADEIQAFGEDFAGFKFTVAIGVFENDELIEPLPFGLADRIAVGFGHPDAAALIESHGDRLMDVGFGDDGLGFEAGREIHLGEGVLGGIGGGVAEVVLFEMAQDRAGLEAFDLGKRVFGACRKCSGEENGGSDDDSGGGNDSGS